MPPKPQLKFSDGEKVLCFHGPLMYEAKCLKAEIRDKVPKYLIHYNGWNKSWDEWVDDTRALKYTEANLEKQKEVQQQQNSTMRKRRRIGANERTSVGKQDKLKKGTETLSVEPARKRRKLEQGQVESEDTYVNRIEVKVTLPDVLKHCLVDDWDLVVRQKQLVELPAKNTVESILNDFVQSRSRGVSSSSGSTSSEREATASEVCEGIREYFNVLLGTQLLYKFERPQYAELVLKHPEKAMCQIYGPEHLLRLFVRIGSVLAYTPLDKHSMSILLSHINSFLRFFSKLSSSGFSADNYHPAAPEYYRRQAT
eukprot:scpid79634/ scgid14397/ Mortality factor 4-like protein 1; MORF-related gene 15 protein; Transcription factor-like protein MRG15